MATQSAGASQYALRPPAHRIGRGAILMWAIQGLFGLGVLVGLGALVAWLLSAWAPPWLPAVVATRVWWAPWIGLAFGLPGVLIEPVGRYLVHRWEVTDETVYTLSGVLEREWRLVPISRIQTVDTTRGLLERMLGLATLRIRTASHAGSSDIPGLPAGTAAGLANDLAVAAAALRDDAT